MNMHYNVHLILKGRELLITRLKRGQHPEDVVCAMGVSDLLLCSVWALFGMAILGLGVARRGRHDNRLRDQQG